MKNAASIAIMDNVVFVCSPDQGMERVDPWTGTSHLQQPLPAAGANTVAANKWIGCVRVPSPAKNDHTSRYHHTTHEDDGFDDDNDDENAHFLLSCTDTAAWLLNKYTMATHDAPCIRFEANARFVAVVDAFLVLFAKFIIEIRHIQTGEIVQVIPGHDIRCVHVQESTIIFTMMKTPHDRISTIYRLVL
ncbi:hypothetical protein BC940DRAFT_25206 [Gongronella butleri]|nr:hypothetical protein BC940DRAFT_25206 [Gongronella butleri]